MNKYEIIAKLKAAYLFGLLIMAGILFVLASAVITELGTDETPVRADLFSTEVTAESPIQFHEIMASNLSWDVTGSGSAEGDEKSKLPDWVELYNRGDAEVSLEGFAIYKNNDPSKLFRFGNETLAPGGYLLLVADGKTGTKDGLNHLPFKISSSADKLVLMDGTAQVIDCVETPMLEKDQVYARNQYNQWEVSITPTPGKMNAITPVPSEEEAQPQNVTPMVTADQLMITEVMTSNVSYAPAPGGRYLDYIEIYNDADFDAELTDWTLTRSDRPEKAWKFPEVKVPSKGYMLVYCAGNIAKQVEEQTGTPILNGCVYAGFRLPSEGCSITFTRSDGVVIDDFEIPALEADTALSLVNGHRTTIYPPTPGEPNTREGIIATSKALQATTGDFLYINEVAASVSGGESDWIELYNGNPTAIDLSGYGLTDNPGKLRKWQFPQGTTIESGDYLQVYCGGNEDDETAVNFALSAKGNYTLLLSRPDGTVLDRVFVPEQFNDVSYGRSVTEDGFWYFEQPTPMTINGGNLFATKAVAPTYSTRGGLFKKGEKLKIELSTLGENQRIYYTLDQTDPSEESTLYTEPIEITENTVLRTRVFGDNAIPSEMDTQTYLFDVNTGNGVYVVSLVSDPHNLLSNEAGIMVKGPNASEEYPYKGANFWKDWEVPGHVEIYDGEGNVVLSEGCGIKLHGQYSRAENQQAFKVIARSKYGTSRFRAKLFSNRDYEDYQSFILRSSGQDTSMTRMRDSVLTSLASDTSVMYQETEVCVMYLDGYYWGQYYLRERINTSSICQFEGWEGQEKDLDLIKANKNVMQGSNETFAQLVEWAKSADPKSSDFYPHLDEVIDIKNYMEYMSLEIFSGNGDTLNVKRYRNKNADGKWRWVLFDLDWAFYVDTDSINRWLTPGGMGTNKYTDNSLFIACMKNPRFRDEFLTLMGERMAKVYTTDNLMKKFSDRYDVLQPLLQEQFERWDMTNSGYTQALKMLLNYAKERPAKLMGYFRRTEYLGLTDGDMEHYFGEALKLVGGLDAIR